MRLRLGIIEPTTLKTPEIYQVLPKIDYETLMILLMKRMIRDELSYRIFSDTCIDYVMISMTTPTVFTYAGPAFTVYKVCRYAGIKTLWKIAKPIIKFTIKPIRKLWFW
jgi:hypothetical protein